MNENAIIMVYVVIDDALKMLGHRSDARAVVSAAEVLAELFVCNLLMVKPIKHRTC